MLKHTYRLLRTAFIVLFIFSSNVLAQDKMDSKLDCEPLPEAERFKALGYELGICKSQVEKLLKEHPNSKSKLASQFEKQQNSEAPERISYIATNYYSVVPPYMNLLPSPAVVILSFFDNVLYYAQIQFSYKKDISTDKFTEIYQAFLDNLIEKYGDQEGAKFEKIEGNDNLTALFVVNNITVFLQYRYESPTDVGVIYFLNDLNLQVYKYKDKINDSKKQMEGF